MPHGCDWRLFEVLGLGVPRMPIGSPGMEMGNNEEPFETLLVFEDGKIQIFNKNAQPPSVQLRQAWHCVEQWTLIRLDSFSNASYFSDDPVNFSQQRQDNEVLSICLETLNHSRCLTAATRVVVDIDGFLHSSSPFFKHKKTLRRKKRLKDVLGY